MCTIAYIKNFTESDPYPFERQFIGSFIGADWWQWSGLLDFPFLYQTLFFGLDFCKQNGRRFVVRILWDKFALDGELEDGLAECGDGFWDCIKKVKVIADEAPGVSEVIRLAGG